MALLKANTGIGTTNPQVALHVFGGSIITGVTTLTTLTAGNTVISGITTVGVMTASSVGIGTTNTGDSLTVLGKVQLQQDSNSNTRLIFRGTPGSSYRWNVDNYQSGNQLRIFREDDSTSANGSVAMQIDPNGNTLITGITTTTLGSSSSPPSNSQMSFALTSNTNLRITVRGTDGVLRTANITLA